MISLWLHDIWMAGFKVLLLTSGMKAVFYLDVSFRGNKVPEALDGPHEVRAMLVQDLNIGTYSTLSPSMYILERQGQFTSSTILWRVIESTVQ